MSQAVPASTSLSPAAAAAARFLAELENAFSALRLYGAAHPAFDRSVEAAAGAAQPPIRLSITPRGFTAEKAPLEDDGYRRLSQRLRSLGLVGLEVESALEPGQIKALVSAINELEAGPGSAQAAVSRISQCTGGGVKATPLRLDKLRLVEGTATAQADDDATSLWQELFSEACQSATPGGAAARELAQSFEAALGVNPSAENWNAMVETWSRQLARMGAAMPPTVGQSAGPAEGGGEAGPGAIDAVSGFLTAMSPHLCQRLMTETVARQIVPEPVVLALAQRLPTTIVLGALSAVDRSNGQPSSAALALLRKVSAQVNDNTIDAAAAARTSEDVARTAASLEKLLQSNREESFVPDEYLRRRQELSNQRMAPQAMDRIACPDDRDTARHAAELVLQMLSSADADPLHIAAGLEFIKARISGWIRSGNFSQAAEAMGLARPLSEHPDETVAAAARSLRAAPLEFDELLEGARHCFDRRAAATTIGQLLSQWDGSAIANLLASANLKGAGSADNVVAEALKHVVTSAPEACMRSLMGGVGEKAPPALLAMFDSLDAEATIRALESLLPHSTPPVRRAVLWKVFTRNVSWPLAFTERMLKDDEPGVRRLAVMRLMRDNDVGTAAKYFWSASRGKEYRADVAVGLAELLRGQRRHPEVRRAYRRWFWSGRRWGALFTLRVGGNDRRRAG